MQRITIDPRANQVAEFAKLGYSWHTAAGVPYWNEDAYYQFTPAEIAVLVQTAERMHGLYVEAVQYVIDNRLFPLMGISSDIARKITEWWDADIPSILGRFDFLYDGVNPPKLLEYNADTPGNLFETAIMQANWREQRFPQAGQFNSLREALTDRWRQLLVGRRGDADQLHVVAEGHSPEDIENVQFVGQCALDAGYRVKYLPIQELGMADGVFYDLDNKPMTQIFKQYAWEWLMKDAFGEFVDPTRAWWLEPMWKMAMSCKGLLPVLWDMYPGHPNLLPAFRSSSDLAGSMFVRKPTWGRQGANIQIVDATGKILSETSGDYTKDGYIYQGYMPQQDFNGYRPNVGVWIVCDKACGLGIREDTGLIMQNNSRFVPHLIG
jgi:glutathionylspermidine synthase